MALQHYLDEIFGNILEIYELTVKVQRMLEDAVEMSDTPCVGAGLWELGEAHEFDVYLTYMVSDYFVFLFLFNNFNYCSLFYIFIYCLVCSLTCIYD